MLSLEHITRYFGSHIAVDYVSLTIERGTIVGLVGENGAGKTTLMRIAAGELDASAGLINIAGPVELVHQHFMLVSEFTIAENLALTGVGTQNVLTVRSLAKCAQQTILASGIELGDVQRRVSALSVAEKAKLELIKAISRKPSLLILDEPTSVLTPAETSELFHVIRRLAEGGTAVVFISHKLPEVREIAQRIVVMRRGRVVANTQSMTAQELAGAMIGERPPQVPEQLKETAGFSRPIALQLDDLVLRNGEITAIVGVAGNGQTELAGRLRKLDHPRSIGHVPEDRTRDGLVAEMSIAENIALGGKGWSPRSAHTHADRLIEMFAIRARDSHQRAGALSGGNQQKLILARELDRQPAILVVAEPTRGLDLDATAFVHEQLRRARHRGAAVLLITSDLDEAFALADIIQVIYRGKLSERMTPEIASARAGALMAGVT